MTWNLEGFSRNIYNLKYFSCYEPDFIMLSKPQIYQNDIELFMTHLKREYCYSLNTADKYDPELPLVKLKAHGGTLVLWKVGHDPFISVHPVSSPSILPIIFNPPNNRISIHVAVYLPTHGQDSKFVEELSSLEVCLHELHDLYPHAPLYLRGDFNVNANNTKRTALLARFWESFDLIEPQNLSSFCWQWEQ